MERDSSAATGDDPTTSVTHNLNTVLPWWRQAAIYRLCKIDPLHHVPIAMGIELSRVRRFNPEH